MKILTEFFDVLATVLILTAALIFAPILSGVRPYIVLSGSMEPEIKTGSVVYVNQRSGIEDVSVGDIIAFYSGGHAVTHRVTRINGNQIVTKGDANRTDDSELVDSKNFIGKTVLTVPYIGYALNSLRTPLAIVIMSVIVIMYITLTAINHKKGELL